MILKFENFDKPFHLKISNLQGQIIYSNIAKKSNISLYGILDSGVYFLQINNSQPKKLLKIIMKLILLYLFLIVSSNLLAQSYSGPESVDYDSNGKRYLVSNSSQGQILSYDAINDELDILLQVLAQVLTDLRWWVVLPVW